MANPERDELSGVETTGHEWDGIKELNNPLPRWWLWTLYGTMLWAAGYAVLYPALPGLTTNSKGLWEWSSRADLRQELAAQDVLRGEVSAKLAAADINGILGDAQLREFAVAAGASTFKVNCVQCHGSGAQGGPGFPNLNDDSWIWGGTPEQILQTIAHGIRSADDPATRDSQMPAFGRDQVLNPTQINDVTHQVSKLAGLEHDAKAAEAGVTVYADNCAACHGPAGEGNIDLGAPQLSDDVWFYGSTPAQISAQVTLPKHGMMPAWQSRLGDVKVKQLTAYVLSLGGGQK